MSADNGFAGPDLLDQLDLLVAAAEVVTPAAPTRPPGKLAIAGRAAQHLAGLPDPIGDRQGRDRLPDAAKDLAIGFALGVDEALPLLRAWNEDRCRPPWDVDALREALEAAARRRPRGGTGRRSTSRAAAAPRRGVERGPVPAALG